MRPRRTTDVVNVTTTDHKISRLPRLADPTGPLKEIDVPIEMPVRQYEFAHRKDNTKRLGKDQFRLYELFARALDDDEWVIDLLADAVGQQHSAAVETTLQLAEMQLKYRKYSDARETLLRSSGDHLSLYHTHLGVSQIGSGEVESAVTSLEKATEIDPANPSAWYNLGVARQRIRDFDGSIRCLEKAIELRPGYALAWRKLGTVLAIVGQPEESARHLKQAIAIDANDLIAYRRLADVKRDQDDFEAAIRVLADARSGTPGVTDQRTELELVWTLLDPDNVDHRDAERASELAEQLLSRNENADTILTSVLALMERNESERALDFLGQRLQQLENERRKPEAGLLMAICQSKMGSRTAAQQNYGAASKAIESNTLDRLARLIRQIADKHFENDR